MWTGIDLSWVDNIYSRNDRISPEKLAARLYPQGDVRNKPDVRAWLDDYLSGPSIDQWFHARRVAVAARKNPQVNCYTWWSWLSWTNDLDKRLTRNCGVPSGDPLSPATIAKLRRLVETVWRELDGNRPGWHWGKGA